MCARCMIHAFNFMDQQFFIAHYLYICAYLIVINCSFICALFDYYVVSLFDIRCLKRKRTILTLNRVQVFQSC